MSDAQICTKEKRKKEKKWVKISFGGRKFLRVLKKKHPEIVFQMHRAPRKSGFGVHAVQGEREVAPSGSADRHARRGRPPVDGRGGWSWSLKKNDLIWFGVARGDKSHKASL